MLSPLGCLSHASPVLTWPLYRRQVYRNLGVNWKLGLEGRPPRPIGALGTSKVRLSGDDSNWAAQPTVGLQHGVGDMPGRLGVLRFYFILLYFVLIKHFAYSVEPCFFFQLDRCRLKFALLQSVLVVGFCGFLY